MTSGRDDDADQVKEKFTLLASGPSLSLGTAPKPLRDAIVGKQASRQSAPTPSSPALVSV